MKILVDRFVSDKDTTISRVAVDGRFVCFGLEDEYRVDKVYGKTRIPQETYNVRVRIEGGHHIKYSKRFRKTHRGMLHIINVPRFEWILIHCGNTNADTGGCLLVGMGAIITPNNMKILGSVSAYKVLYRLTIETALEGNLRITFKDNDR